MQGQSRHDEGYACDIRLNGWPTRWRGGELVCVRRLALSTQERLEIRVLRNLVAALTRCRQRESVQSWGAPQSASQIDEVEDEQSVAGLPCRFVCGGNHDGALGGKLKALQGAATGRWHAGFAG